MGMAHLAAAERTSERATPNEVIVCLRERLRLLQVLSDGGGSV